MAGSKSEAIDSLFAQVKADLLKKDDWEPASVKQAVLQWFQENAGSGAPLNAVRAKKDDPTAGWYDGTWEVVFSDGRKGATWVINGITVTLEGATPQQTIKDVRRTADAMSFVLVAGKEYHIKLTCDANASLNLHYQINHYTSSELKMSGRQLLKGTQQVVDPSAASGTPSATPTDFMFVNKEAQKEAEKKAQAEAKKKQEEAQRQAAEQRRQEEAAAKKARENDEWDQRMRDECQGRSAMRENYDY